MNSHFVPSLCFPFRHSLCIHHLSNHPNMKRESATPKWDTHIYLCTFGKLCFFVSCVSCVCVCSPKRMFSRVACLVELQTTSKHDGCNGQSHCSCCLHITNVFVCIYILVEWLLFFLAKLVSLTRTRVKCQKYSTSIHRFEFHSKPHTNFRLRRPPAAEHAVDECDAATNVIESVD